MSKRLTTEEFVERAKSIHSGKYDYSKVNYVDSHTKVCIICPEHGEFWQAPTGHLSGKGCKRCSSNFIWGLRGRKTTENVVNAFKQVHGNKYDYSKVVFKGMNEKVCVTCNEHGDFWTTPKNHMDGKGCMKCSIKNRAEKRKLTTEDFIERAKKIHGDRYDYSKVKYINNSTKVCIICPEHGEFWQTPINHLKGCECISCSGIKPHTTDEIIGKFKQVHGDKYDYSKVEYVNVKTKVCIICPEHGEFWQTPSNHLNGKGCGKCNESHLERYVRNVLEENNIQYEYQKRFSWLGKQSLDFYLPNHNIAIECQGEQHYKPVDFAGNGECWAKNEFLKNIERDKIKFIKTNENNIRMLYIDEYNKNKLIKKLK